MEVTSTTQLSPPLLKFWVRTNQTSSFLFLFLFFLSGIWRIKVASGLSDVFCHANESTLIFFFIVSFQWKYIQNKFILTCCQFTCTRDPFAHLGPVVHPSATLQSLPDPSTCQFCNFMAKFNIFVSILHLHDRCLTLFTWASRSLSVCGFCLPASPGSMLWQLQWSGWWIRCNSR